jgi:hypothetical protein
LYFLAEVISGLKAYLSSQLGEAAARILEGSERHLKRNKQG